jgi:hypothetical protein
MKLAIIGSRTFNDYELLKTTILNKFEFSTIEKIVSGGAKGADTLGERFAAEFNILFEVFPADWKKHGRAAGYIRNTTIIQSADTVIAFWDGTSRGTKHSIDLAKKLRKELFVKLYSLKES